MSLHRPELLEPLATVEADQEVTFSDPTRAGLVVLHYSGQGEETQSAGDGSVRAGADGARSGVEVSPPAGGVGTAGVARGKELSAPQGVVRGV